MDDDHNARRAVLCEPPLSPLGALSPYLVPAAFTSGAEPAGSVVGWQALVKLAYEDVKAKREHLWFEAHSFRDGHVDATLLSTPRAIPSLVRGHRGWHSIHRLTDWVAGTPFGTARPWFVKPLRMNQNGR